MRKSIILLGLSALLTTSIMAQKFGYVNSNELLASLPEVKAADAELETYQTQLVAQGQAKVKTFETNYQAYLNDVNAGVLSKIQMADREKNLGTEQQAIADFEKEVQMKVLQKREELLQPILTKVDEAIQAVGKENGYTFIFDAGASGTVLFAPEQDNLIDLIKSKLGVQ